MLLFQLVARSAETSAAAAQTALEQSTAAKAAIESQMAGLRQEKAGLEASKAALEGQKAQLETEKGELEKQKAELLARLQGALSKVAETKSTARGFIVNLPDILFDTNEATLKPEAKITIAKLSGIMLLMSELNVRVEGHTDSTGSAAHNQTLSQKRAESVLAFLTENGLVGSRMTAVGYGMDKPITSNKTAKDKAKNRRTEIEVVGTRAAP